jgi:hypothetical protein
VKNLTNFLLFQVGWFACVKGAERGDMWIGPLVVGAIVAVHLRFVAQPSGRRRELAFVVLVAVVGLVADTGLRALGATSYPTSMEWGHAVVPPWIIALWALFATLPFHSMRWLARRPLMAIALGAVGGPLSYLSGVRIGAVGVGDDPLLTWSAISVEYAVATPLLLWIAAELSSRGEADPVGMPRPTPNGVG